MAERIRIMLEFSKNKPEDLELYAILQNYSSPSSYIKDVLRGLVAIPKEYREEN